MLIKAKPYLTEHFNECHYKYGLKRLIEQLYMD